MDLVKGFYMKLVAVQQNGTTRLALAKGEKDIASKVDIAKGTVTLQFKLEVDFDAVDLIDGNTEEAVGRGLFDLIRRKAPQVLHVLPAG